MSGADVARATELVLGIATVLLLVQIALPGVRPWAVVADTLRRTVRSGRRLRYLAACLSILLFNYLYLVLELDDRCTRWIVARRGEDFTSLIRGAIEGDAVARIQAATAWLPLTYFFGYVYVIVFPCLVFVSILVFDHLGRRRGLAMALLGYAANFLIVLPFYLCFPVREVFVFYRQAGLAELGPRMLLDDISPLIMQAYRTMSGVDNCFPSFHTSLAITLAIVAWHAGRRSFGWVITLFAAANVASTIYLGVHWLTDVAAGILVGILAYVVARRLSRHWETRDEADSLPRSEAAGE